MPITKSAKKALRQTKRRTAKNRAQKKELDILIKRVTAKDLSQVVSKIDKAAKVSLISTQRASRIKSRLYKKLKPGKLNPRPKTKIPRKPAKTKTKTRTEKK
jgi:ribosomal protein S20